MDPMNLALLGFPLAIILLMTIALYKIFIKKRPVSLFYTPFEEVTGQSQVAFHEEQEVIAEDDEQGDDKNKNKMGLKSSDIKL